MKFKTGASASLLLLLGLAATALRAQDTRTLTLIEDYDQKYMCSRVFELKNVFATDITPFIEGSIKRYNKNSNIQRLCYKLGQKQFIVVSTGVDMMPYVVDMVAKLDRPCSKKDASKSIVDGDGIYRFTYTPKFRATDNMRDVLTLTISDGASYFDPGTNLFYWKDSKSDGETQLKFLKALDRPLPQANICIKAYEINENDFAELGIDYVNWKNGPGASLLGMGYDWTNFTSSDNVSSWTNNLNIVSKGPASSVGGLGGFMVAPQFDATFLRMLNQKGKAKVATSGSIVLVNDASSDPGSNNYSNAKYRLRFTPNYDVIKKDSDQKTSVDAFNENFYFYLRNPTIGCNDEGTKTDIVMFGWVLYIENEIERTNTGTPVINQQFFRSALTIAAGSEKLIGTYTKEHKVKQSNAMPFLGDIPGFKYLTGAFVESKTRSRVFITVEASPVLYDTSLSGWAGKVVEAAELIRKEDI